MKQSSIKNSLYTLTIVLLSLFAAACSDNNDTSLDIGTPNSCVFRGPLDLDNQTQNLLEKYKRTEAIEALPRSVVE